jgi:hypothetical protein
MAETLAPIEDIVAAAGSYEELMEGLADAMPRLASSKAIEALVKGMFKARATGDRRDG